MIIDNRVNERDRKQPFPAGNASYQYRISAFIKSIYFLKDYSNIRAAWLQSTEKYGCCGSFVALSSIDFAPETL